MQDLLTFLSQLQLLDYAVLSINLVLLIFARRILHLLYHESDKTIAFTRKLMIFRALNILIVIAFGYYHVYLPTEEKGPWLKLVSILVIFYMGYVSMHLLHYIILKRYGKTKDIDGKMKQVATYQTRLLNIFGSVFLSIVALISVIRVLDFNSLLEAGGVIGFVGVFLALTQSTWAPDIFSGLIILNSDMVEEGDVIEIKEGESVYGIVYKTKIFHTEILNLVNNHRIMIRNTRLREFTVHNLSKFASAKGLREKLTFKIGYDAKIQQINKLFANAFAKAVTEESLPIESQHGFESGVINTGDHAVEWAFYYYTKEVSKLLLIRQRMKEIFLETSRENGISLATPITHSVRLEQKSALKTENGST